MPVDCGSITASSALAAIAASAAVPPARKVSIAASEACGCEVATMPFWAWTVERPANWKFLIPRSLFLLRVLWRGCHDISAPDRAMLGARVPVSLAVQG